MRGGEPQGGPLLDVDACAGDRALPGRADRLVEQRTGGAHRGLGARDLRLHGAALGQRALPPVGTFPPASAIRSSSAPRAMPRLTAAIASASSPNSGNA